MILFMHDQSIFTKSRKRQNPQKKNEYIGIVGNVGSGKSSFLLALMQEMNHNKNGVYSLSESLKESSIAFVSQKPWLLKKSIRDNIIMFEEYNSIWYKTVIEACGLDIDFFLMQNGDLTQISDHGSSLSGGQKSRICLARAVYHRADIYLLDDPLSSLDVNVASLIVEKVISSLLYCKTVVMTTHNVQFFSKFKESIRVPDKIFCIKNGIIGQTDAKLVDIDFGRNDLELVIKSSECENTKENEKEISSFINREHMETGTIKFNVYLGYVKLIGYFLMGLILSSLLLMQGTKNLSEYWLSLWSSRSTNVTKQNFTEHISFAFLFSAPVSIFQYTRLGHSSVDFHFDYYLKIYLIIVLLNFLFSFIRGFSFAFGGIKASFKCHNKLLTVLIKAKLNFFETTSRGQILNRFTSDLSTIDDNLPFIVNIFLANIFTCIGSLVVVSISLPFVVFIILPIIYFCYYLQFVYRMTSRSIKRLISVNRSPLFSHFSEIIEGTILIRNFRMVDKFIEENNALLSNLIRCEYSGLVLSSWLAMRLQIMGILFITIVVAISLVVHYFNYVDKSLIGLACVYSFSLSNLLSNLITSATESEKEFIAVERCFEYIFPNVDDKRFVSEFEDENVFDISLHSTQTITIGAIEFKHVYLRYIENDSYSLADVNFAVKPGETVGVIGRTGSGKSSLIKLLFRLYSVDQELINNKSLVGYSGEIFIDSTNISDYNIRNLRLSISSMMQDSMVFSGTLRQNLDPTRKHTDGQINAVVVKLQLDIYFPEFRKDGFFNLNGFIANQGRELSQGQHQLLCLGRIMLSDNKIICLDEPSAYLDANIETVIENIILNEFSNKTVLIVGHRLPMLTRICDSILVMDQGKVLEYGTVRSLLENSNSYLSEFIKL